MLVLTLAFHTYIAYYISKSKKGFENNIKQIKISPIKLHEEDKLDADNSKMMQEQVLNRAVWLNRIANIVFVAFMIVFNIIFWIVAFMEHTRPGKEYINE